MRTTWHLQSPDPAIPLQGIHDGLTDQDALAAATFAEHSHHKFIAAQPADKGMRASRLTDAFGGDHEHRIPHRMAKAVVDALEIIQIDEKNCAGQPTV